MLNGTRRDTARLLVCAAALSLICHSRQAGPESAPVPAKFKAPPPTPIAIEKVQLGEPSWDAKWDHIIEDALPPELLSSKVAPDVATFCPHFRKMDQPDMRAFWAYFFQALAGAEAGLSPTASVRHTEPEVAVVDTVTRRMVRAEGLLQLTYMDADRYGCDFDWESDKELPERDPTKTILQPRNNLTCGIRILKDQLIDRNEKLISRNSYWETLRPGTPGFPNFIRQMTNLPDACRTYPSRARTERASKARAPHSSAPSSAETANSLATAK